MTEQTSEPTFVSIARTMHELGGCSRGYVYELLGKGILRSVNPGGNRRLIEFASIRNLLRRKSKAIARPKGGRKSK